MLLIVCGLPGSGKTTIAEALSKRLKAPHISSDIIRKQMHERPVYSEEEKRDVYRAMAARALEMFRGGEETVVLDATYYKKEYLEMAKWAAQKAGSMTLIIECTISDKEAKRRIGGRKKGPSDADFEVYLKLKGEAEAIEDAHLTIDCSEPVIGNIERIIAYLEEMERPDA